MTERPTGRHGAPTLPVAHPLATGMPAAYIGEGPLAGFPQSFLSAFDAVLAPVVATLDDVEAYFCADTAPEDFLRWLAGWVALDSDDRWSEAELRVRVRRAASVYAGMGTLQGIRDGIELLCGVTAEVSDSGGAIWSARPGSALPGDASAQVRVAVPPGTDVGAVERAVRQLVPAHVRRTVVVS